MLQPSLAIYIFSFNRGAFLANAISSCQLNAPEASITVVDDNSSDVATVDFLQKLPDGVALIQPEKIKDARHGGLYNNMQRALGDAQSDYVLFLQDDVQLVRPLAQDDYQYIEDFFTHFSSKAFLNPVFLKGQRHKRDNRITYLHADFPCYFRDYPEKKRSTGLTYSDIVIVHRQRLVDQDWQFAASEKDSASKAKALFGEMGFMAHPFVMYLPQVPVYRGKVKTSAVALAEKWSGTEPKRFLEKSSEFWQQFKQRDLSQLPVAETFLNCCDEKISKPYQYSAVNAYPLLRVWHKLTLLFTGK